MTKKNKRDKTLIIVESPNKIKKILSFLDGSYIIKASFGHIFELKSDKKNKLGVNIEKGFEPQYGFIPDKKDKIAAIIDSTSEVKEVLLATDCDREGECISFHVKECIESAGIPIKRIIFNEITKTAVLNAIKNPRDLDKNLYDAQQARRVLDRLVGFMVSPYVINKFGTGSAGRCQSVAVRLIIDREKEIETFKPEEYWTIFSNLVKINDKKAFRAKYVKKVTDKATAQKIKKDLENDTYIVLDVDSKEKKRNPFPPLITSTLQQAAAGKYGFSVNKTMKAAQSLFESGYITYMRTDSTHISSEALVAVRDWLSTNNYKIPNKPNVYSSKNSQEAHECIRPSDVSKIPDDIFLPEDQQKVYKLVWERFLSSQMEPAIYDTVSVLIKTSSNHELKANGRVLKYLGWLEIAKDLINDKKSDDEDDVQLPILKVKDNLVLVPPKVQADQKFTQPPPRYSEANLVKELEKRGIGRPSTFASICSTIQNRGYVELKGKIYHGTPSGKKVIDKLSKYFDFLNYNYTSNMESQLDLITEGKLTYVKMLETFYEPFKENLKTAYNDDSEHKTDINCPNCNNKMLVKDGKFGYYIQCFDYNKCKTNISCELIDGKIVIKSKKEEECVPGVFCEKCKSPMIKKSGKFGDFYACKKYPKCKGTRKIPYGLKCNKCNGEFTMSIFDGIKKLACMEYPNCKNIIDIPKK
jgi:DNA topoisomerase-1